MSIDGGLQGRISVVTGGTGVLGGAIAHGLAKAGAMVGILGRNSEKADRVVDAIHASGGEAMTLIADVLSIDEMSRARERIEQQWGNVDILVNAAGGHVPEALTGPDRTFFDLPERALRSVIDLNLLGTILSSQVFGASMADATIGEPSGSIINFSSMSADRAISRAVGYGAAKAGVDNFTRWLASDLAAARRPIRVNAIAPGFFVAETNRSLLVDRDGPTARGKLIIERTPAARFGAPDELVGAVLWLASAQASFVTGVVIPIDGGFSAFSGV